MLLHHDNQLALLASQDYHLLANNFYCIQTQLSSDEPSEPFILQALQRNKDHVVTYAPLNHFYWLDLATQCYHIPIAVGEKNVVIKKNDVIDLVSKIFLPTTPGNLQK